MEGDLRRDRQGRGRCQSRAARGQCQHHCEGRRGLDGGEVPAPCRASNEGQVVGASVDEAAVGPLRKGPETQNVTSTSKRNPGPCSDTRFRGPEVARATGIEPATTGSTVRYSNQLSYAPTP